MLSGAGSIEYRNAGSDSAVSDVGPLAHWHAVQLTGWPRGPVLGAMSRDVSRRRRSSSMQVAVSITFPLATWRRQLACFLIYCSAECAFS